METSAAGQRDGQQAAADVGASVPGPASISAQSVHADPEVQFYRDFISPEEVEHLLQLCEGRWERSLVSKGKASEMYGAEAKENGKYGEEAVGESRTSMGVHLDFEESIVVERVAARVASVTGSSLEFVEPLVLLKYEAGQYFKLHHDGAMRKATVFVYLNDVDHGAGGQTYFPQLGFECHPSAGTALMWYNRSEDGTADQRLQHEAKPLLEGVKYGMNCFVNVSPQRDTSGIILVHAKPAEAA